MLKNIPVATELLPTSLPALRSVSTGEATLPHPAELHSVLVPVDLTSGSDRVLGRLALLPLADDAQVTVLHVVPGNLPPGEQRMVGRDAKKALVDEVRHLRNALPPSVRLHSLTKVGSVAKEIAASATHAKADLIVMGRGGGRALRDAFLGSTAERVVRQTRLPVLVVRLAPRAPYKRPALALDLDQPAHDIVRLMLALLIVPRPRVTVIHAQDTPRRALIYPGLSTSQAEEMDDELRTRAAGKLARLLATALDEANIPAECAPFWQTHIRVGSPRTVVEKEVRRAESDLLVLGTRGYTGAALVFLGTVAGELLREAKCDVLIVPPTAPPA